ncbi:uncharacterized protein LOC143878433 [Tasmannia lanceolata]|uniref:uncharacterized protein LOC143878433 n=1 Tax=Tasmannia lanceolata TaxID=3420 RepID=UPI0040645B63
MNLSFRAQEKAHVMKEKEEELALFLEMRKREKDRNNLSLLHDFDLHLGSKQGSSSIFKIVSSTPCKNASDNFLNSEGEKNDYDWLLTPPRTPLFPFLEMESNRSTLGQIGTPKARPTSLKSRLANPQMEAASRGSLVSRQPTLYSDLNSSNTGMWRYLSSRGPGSSASRPATPTERPTLPATSRPYRPTTPTSRATFPSSKPVAPSARSSAPATRSSTPTPRPSVPSSKSASRSATPTRRPSTPNRVPTSCALPTSRNPVPSRGTSTTIKSRSWKASEMPGFSLDTPPNLRTSLPERPASTSRSRPGTPSSCSSSVDTVSNGRPRRQSCSPSRGRVPNDSIHKSGSSFLTASISYSIGNDSVSPVLIGNKMVKRIVNQRRLAPPKQDKQPSNHNNAAGKSSLSPDSTLFGRTLSKESLDISFRHMDISRSIPGSLRPLMTNIRASSMYSMRSRRTDGVLDSPIATSSNASSEQSFSNNILSLDGSEIEDDDFGSERGSCFSFPSHLGR